MQIIQPSKDRALCALVILLGCSVVLLARLAYLQLLKHHFYSTLSKQNVLSIIRLSPARGLIYDRNGVLLAKNIPSYRLVLIPEKVKNLPKTIAELSKILPISDKDMRLFEHYRHQYHAFDPIPLKLQMNEQDTYVFYVNQYRFPGVMIQANRSGRYYPLGSLCSEIIGHMGRIGTTELAYLTGYDAADQIGKDGIERYYETVLHGTAGAEEAEVNAAGQVVRTLKTQLPAAGKNIYLTIDSDLQTLAHTILGAENGTVVAIQPATGEILALVSHPSFDSNLFTHGISSDHYKALLYSPNHPLYNRAIRGQFPAGSTLKPFIALASLDRGVLTRETQINDPGWFRLPKTKHIYRDWVLGGHGNVDVIKAIQVSCDTFFYTLAPQLGIQQLVDILSEFGFGQKTGIDLPGERAGLLPSPAWKMQHYGTPWYPGDTVETVIGQGFVLVTPIQLANAVAILANRGQKTMRPHLLLKTVTESGNTHIQQPVALSPPAITQQWPWDLVVQAMESVIDGLHGTASHFGKHPDYRVAGKTGTAQVYSHTRDENRDRTDLPKHLQNNHLFIAFAPIDNPQIAIAIIVEHGAAADKIAGELINFYLKNKIIKY